jgi:hypothetical protein
MGGPQVWFELADHIDDPAWNDILAEYGEFYHFSAEKKQEYSQGKISSRGWGLAYTAAALAAYSARHNNKPELADFVWNLLRNEVSDGKFDTSPVEDFSSSSVKIEAEKLSTNFVAQWCLNVIACMGLIGDRLK